MENITFQIAAIQGELSALLGMQIHIQEKVNDLNKQKKELEKQL